MKIRLTVDENEEERIEIFSHKRSELVRQIEQLVESYEITVTGYGENEILPLKKENIFRVFVENNKVYASTDSGKYRLKLRLYEIEEMLGEAFLKVNQSSLVNRKHIKKFSSSFGGSLKVELTNGETDFISRRQTKYVLKRMGIK